MNVSLALEEKKRKKLIMGHLYPTNLNLYVLVVREKSPRVGTRHDAAFCFVRLFLHIGANEHFAHTGPNRDIPMLVRRDGHEIIKGCQCA